MELTGVTNRLEELRRMLQGSAMPIGILVLIAMMVLPLPAFLLDTFFVFNILLSLLILMVAMHSHRPLDFSSFPNLLLLATILRLSLNVASTRIVLTDGHNGPDAAGKVIQAFGDFVVSGNYTVGIFVFIILANLSAIYLFLFTTYGMAWQRRAMSDPAGVYIKGRSATKMHLFIEK